MTVDRLLTMDQTAEMMGISGSCIRGRVSRHQIPVTRFKRAVLIRLSDVVAIMDAEAAAYPDDLTYFIHPDRFIDSHGAAGLLHISMQTFHLWKHKHLKPYGSIDGKTYFYRSDVEALRDGLKDRGILREKKIYNKRPESSNKSDYHLVGRDVKIKAKCPFCHKEHSVKVPEESSRWIFCRDHEYLRYKSYQQPLRVRSEISLFG